MSGSRVQNGSRVDRHWSWRGSDRWLPAVRRWIGPVDRKLIQLDCHTCAHPPASRSRASAPAVCTTAILGNAGWFLKAGCRNSGPPLIHDLVAGRTPVGGESRPANAVSSDSATVQYQRSLMMTHALPRLSWPGLARSPTSFGRRRRGRDVDGRATPGHDGGSMSRYQRALV